MAGASRRSRRAQSEWKVDTHIRLQSEPSSASTRAAHLFGGLVRESDGQHFMRGGVPVADEVGDAACDDARLARAGAGEDEQRSVDVKDRFALFGVERIQELQSRISILPSPTWRDSAVDRRRNRGARQCRRRGAEAAAP